MSKRYRVDFKFGGYISLDESEYDKALSLYKEQGIRLRYCNDVFDEGIVIEGPPVYVDLTLNKETIN